MLCQSLAGAPGWFAACAADNTREFWQAHKQQYADQVRAPFLQLLRNAGEDTDGWRVYRPHQDVRFRPGAGALKTFLGALHVAPDGTGRYLQVSADGLLASSGLPYLAADQLPRWRAAVAGADGEHLDRVLACARAGGARIKSGYPAPLVRVPRGHPPDHPRAELLRWKGVEVYARTADAAVSAAWVTRTWAAGAELRAWLAEHVGISALERPR